MNPVPNFGTGFFCTLNSDDFNHERTIITKRKNGTHQRKDESKKRTRKKR